MSNLQVGDTVNYHAIIGGPVSSTDHVIEDIERAPNNYGCDVAWVTGKRGCVAMRALSVKQRPSQSGDTE